MRDAKSNPVVRFLPSLTDVAFLLPVAFLFLVMHGASTMLGDGDTGWHVRTGEWIMRNGRIPHTDMFSFTMTGRPWFAWEWLWDVAFAWLHQRWGLTAVVIASMVVLGLTFALLFRLILRKCPNPFVALGMTALAAAGSSIHYLARPHLFTLLFTVLFFWILEAASENRPRLLGILPVLMVVWTNVHGGFLIGLILLAIYAAGNLAEWLLETDREKGSAALARTGWFLGGAVACFAATFVNPYFYHLHVHIYEYLRDPQLWQTIQEYQPLTFMGFTSLFGEPIFALAILACAWSVYRRRFTYALLLAAWAHTALMAGRNLPIFMLIAAPIVAQMLGEGLQLAKRHSARAWIRLAATWIDETGLEFGPLDRIPRVHLASVAAIALLALVLYTPQASPKFRAEYDPSSYPAKALNVLRGPETQRIFTHDEWGDYLIYNLYPTRKVFVDGRSDFYGPKFFKKYLDVMRVKFDWEENLNQYSVDTILLPVDEALAGALKQSPRWRVVYDDGVAIVFRLNQPRNTFQTRVSGTWLPIDSRHDQGVTAARGSNETHAPTPRTRS